jgi:hypothetical protein
MKSLPADLGLGFYRFLPLIAWAVISLVPPQIAVLAWLLWRLFGMWVGYPVQKVPGLSDVLGFSALIAEATWPFLALHFVTRWRARKRWPPVAGIIGWTLGSLAALGWRSWRCS